VTADLSVMAIANCIGTASESMEPLSHIVAWVACPGSAQLRTASVKLQTPNACFAACTGSDSFDADTPTKSSDLEIRMLTVADISAYHKNGNRQDNRLENLELWSSHQPYGQRIEDKLVWAREIIARYG
jgi:hypothetical protein